MNPSSGFCFFTCCIYFCHAFICVLDCCLITKVLQQLSLRFWPFSGVKSLSFLCVFELNSLCAEIHAKGKERKSLQPVATHLPKSFTFLQLTHYTHFVGNLTDLFSWKDHSILTIDCILQCVNSKIIKGRCIQISSHPLL